MGLAAETQQKIPDQSIRDLSQAAMEGHLRSGRVQNAGGRKNNKALPPYQKGRPKTGEGSVREDCVEDRAEAREERLTGADESTTPECPKDREQKPGLEHPSLLPSHPGDRNSI